MTTTPKLDENPACVDERSCFECGTRATRIAVRIAGSIFLLPVDEAVKLHASLGEAIHEYGRKVNPRETR